MQKASRSVVDQFCSVLLKVLLIAAMMLFVPLGCSCIKIAPHALSDASVVSENGRLKSGNDITGHVVNFRLIFLRIGQRHRLATHTANRLL